MDESERAMLLEIQDALITAQARVRRAADLIQAAGLNKPGTLGLGKHTQAAAISLELATHLAGAFLLEV